MKQLNLNEINQFLAHKNHLQYMFQDPIECCRKTVLGSY